LAVASRVNEPSLRPQGEIIQRNNARQIGDIAGESTEIVIAAGDLDGNRQLRVVVLEVGLARTKQFELQAAADAA